MSSDGDRAALVALFRSTGGTQWDRKLNWDTDAGLWLWEGVKVNNDGRVVKLNLYNNNLKGTIPEAVGALAELKELGLGDNKLTGPIPEALGALTELNILRLSNNELTGSIPGALRALKELRELYLGDNNLTGPIPKALGALTELKELSLSSNKLTGPIPVALGALTELKFLYLYGNKLTGPIPEALGALKKLTQLLLYENKLTGFIPTSLGSLSKLKHLDLEDNRLVGTIPAELGNLHALKGFEFGSNVFNGLLRRGNKLTGGPAKGEGLDSWRARIRPTQEMKPPTLKVEQKADAPVPPTSPTPVLLLQPQPDEGEEKEEDGPVPALSTPPVLVPQQQEVVEGDNEEENTPLPLGSPNQRQEAVGERVPSPEHGSSSPEKAEEVDRVFRTQLPSSAGLDSLIRVNPEALQDIQRVMEAQVAGSFHADDDLGSMEGRRKLGTLVTMSTALGEVALRHTEDMNIQRKELALAPFQSAYYTAVRTGLCNAYLAASVIGSDWVATSKTGGTGKAGAALNLMSSAVPVIGGLTGLTGKALQAGDHYLQTRRLVKVTAMAPDAVECCSLARRLALELADGLRNDASATTDVTDQVRVDTTAGMTSGSGSGRGADMLPGDMSEEDVFEYLLEEVASYESNDRGGKRLGKRHLRKLLNAIQRGCLDGSTSIEQKIEVLLLEVLPEADIRPAAMPHTPKEVIVRSPPVVAPAQDSGLPSMADFAALQATVDALKLDRETQQAELEELQAAKDKQQDELKAMGSANKKLQRQVQKLAKHVPEVDNEPDGDVDCGGGLALRRRVAVTETAEGFLDRARDRAAAAADHHPVTVSQQREFEALQDEKHRDHEARFRELEGEISKATTRKGRR